MLIMCGSLFIKPAASAAGAVRLPQNLPVFTAAPATLCSIVVCSCCTTTIISVVINICVLILILKVILMEAGRQRRLLQVLLVAWAAQAVAGSCCLLVVCCCRIPKVGLDGPAGTAALACCMNEAIGGEGWTQRPQTPGTPEAPMTASNSSTANSLRIVTAML